MEREKLVEIARLKYKGTTKNISHALKFFLIDANGLHKDVTIFITKKQTRPEKHTETRQCSNPDCDGAQTLSRICRSCAEGKAGYTKKWTCGICNRRDLEKGTTTP